MIDGTLRQVLDELKDDQSDGSGVKIGTSYAQRLAAEQAEQVRAKAIADTAAAPRPVTSKPEPIDAGSVSIEPRGGGNPYGATVNPSDVDSIVNQVAAGRHSETPLTQRTPGTWA
ncbi:hypothetical protein [Williamsia muralis]|uniref:Uncharacterized protein n=1 Tax=Williamsia marianensis TaxID=85044 RepID=A0A2G3PFQ9_WILMA|nr:hypothetical protein [Williamsia marianensis]PHV64638.1 hypothetical protein CSW57_22835 [Williamsia marianensis]